MLKPIILNFVFVAGLFHEAPLFLHVLIFYFVLYLKSKYLSAPLVAGLFQLVPLSIYFVLLYFILYLYSIFRSASFCGWDVSTGPLANIFCTSILYPFLFHLSISFYFYISSFILIPSIHQLLLTAGLFQLHPNLLSKFHLSISFFLWLEYFNWSPCQ